MIDAHRAAFEYDWRARFCLPLTVIGAGMTWGEAGRLAQILASDPASALSASLAGWQYPISREGLMLADLIDRYSQVHFKRPQPYPRPSDPRPKHFGNQSYTPAALREILDKHRAEVTDG